MMTQNLDEDSQHVNTSYVSNQLRSNQIRNKKNSLPHDREQLYAENIELKSKVKQLTEINLKLRTQLSINEKEKVNLCNIAQEELFHSKLGARSHTGHKKSVTNINAQQNGQSLFNNVIQKEKQSIAFKKIVRDQNIEMQKLNNQVQRLKKTMKYTRMNQILAQNTQMLNQTLRLKDVIAQMKQNQNRFFSEYANQIENLRKKLNNQKDSEKRNGFELKKQLQINLELKDKLNQIQSKKIDLEKRFNKEIKQYRIQISDLKSKLLQNISFRGKQCEKEQCSKIRKQRLQLKKKNQNIQKEVKKLNGELQQKIKIINQKDIESKKMQQTSSISKTPEKKQKTTPNVKKEESKLSQRNQSKIHLEDQSRKKDQTESMITNKTMQKVQIVSLQKIQVENQLKKTHLTEFKKKVVQKPKTKQKNDSMDTQKLLQSQQFQKTENLKIESVSQIKQANQTQKNKASEANQKKQKILQQVKNKLAQSDGQYENLDYDQFQDEQQKNVKDKKEQTKKKKKGQKESKKQKQKDTIEDDKKQKQTKKTKQKSIKKLQSQPTKNKDDDQEQILYNAEKQKETKQVEGDKQELKLMRDTLIYKFMAQNYSFQNFCNDINSSDMKEFSITDIMNLLNGQPFLLNDQQIQLVIIYLFDTNQPTGEQSLLAKEFMKKMKKFIGKAKAIKQEQQSTNIQLLSQIILKDEQGEKKMRKKWAQMDAGDGSITVQQFKKVMSSFKVKDSLLQTAISQIAYVSQDLNHLNYDFFLKRFLQAEN